MCLRSQVERRQYEACQNTGAHLNQRMQHLGFQNIQLSTRGAERFENPSTHLAIPQQQVS